MRRVLAGSQITETVDVPESVDELGDGPSEPTMEADDDLERLLDVDRP